MNKKLLLSAFIAGSLTLAASTAQSAAVATSYLNIYDFALTKDTNDDMSGDTKLIAGVDVLFQGAVTNNGDTNAELNGATDSNTSSAPASAAGLDTLASCVNCTYVENSFSYLTQPTIGSPNYALGDNLLSGAIVNIGGPTPDADAKTLAEANVETRNGEASASGNNVGVQGSFEFTALATNTIYLDFLATGYLRAMLSADVSGVSADAGYNWNFTVRNVSQGNALVLNYAPNDLNNNISATVPGDDFEVTSLNASVFGTSFSVVTGDRYQLTIDHVSDANAHTIPTPAPLALMGLGLFGLAWTQKRKVK